MPNGHSLDSFQPSNYRVMCEIEGTLRRGTYSPRINYNSGKVEGYKSEVQEILSTLNEPNSPRGEKLGVGECAPHPMRLDPQDPATVPVSESGASFPRLC